MADMTDLISPNEEYRICRVDRNDIYLNYTHIYRPEIYQNVNNAQLWVVAYIFFSIFFCVPKKDI